MNKSRATWLLIDQWKNSEENKKIFTIFPIDQSEATIFIAVFQPTNQKLMT
jgi:hypothetical protein